MKIESFKIIIMERNSSLADAGEWKTGGGRYAQMTPSSLPMEQNSVMTLSR